MSVSIVTNEDNMLMMSRYPDKFFDLAIVDVPYGIKEDGRKTKGRNEKKDGSKIIKFDTRNGARIKVKTKQYHHGEWDNKPPSKEYFDELIRVSKNQIIWGANHFISMIPYNSPCWIVWDKVNGEADFADCELAWTSFKSAVRQFTFMWSGFKQGKSISDGKTMQGNFKLNEERIHPTHKPIKLYQWLLLNYGNAGDKILDTNMGSQASRCAAYDLGYDYYGCEIDPIYFKDGCKKYDKHIHTLFSQLNTTDQVAAEQTNLF